MPELSGPASSASRGFTACAPAKVCSFRRGCNYASVHRPTLMPSAASLSICTPAMSSDNEPAPALTSRSRSLAGLLNNDCLWSCDEVQLMGPGVATARQLEAFRNATCDTAGPRGLASFFGSRSATWYASATSNPSILNTREWRDLERPAGFAPSLTEAARADATSTIGRRRTTLKKRELHQDWHFGNGQPPDERVASIIDKHCEMVAKLQEHTAPADVARRSLVICNTVGRAASVFDALLQKQEAGSLEDVDLVLLHSRFRPPDRRARTDRLKPEHLQNFEHGQIVVATQVIDRNGHESYTRGVLRLLDHYGPFRSVFSKPCCARRMLRLQRM